MTPNSLAFNLGLALATLAFSVLVVVLKKNGLISADMAERGLGVFLGLLLVVYANFIPKQVSRSHPTGRRFAAWTLVVAFLGYAAIWAFAPAAYTLAGSLAVVLTAMGVILAYCFAKRARAG